MPRIDINGDLHCKITLAKSKLQKENPDKKIEFDAFVESLLRKGLSV